MTPDSDIVRGLQSGSSEAFDQMYRRYRDRIWSFLVRLAGNGALAEDLFQDTWLAAARRAHLLREDTAILRWLYTIAHNKHRNARRDGLADLRKREQVLLAAVDPPPADAAVVARLDVAATGAAIDRMPEAFREVLVLCGCQGLEAPDAAAVLGISPEAVRKRLSRARAALAAELEHEQGGRDG